MKGKKNLGEGRAKPRTVYPLLYASISETKKESAAWSAKGRNSEKVLNKLHHLDQILDW